MQLTILGAAREVTGSLYLVEAGGQRLLVECGLIQGDRDDERRNAEDFPFSIDDIDAVVLSHAHLDHSGRLPLLVQRGYRGPIYTHAASKALCEIMLRDSGYLHEKDAEFENRRRKPGEPPVLPLYTREDAEACLPRFVALEYGEEREILPGLRLRLADAGHILGSAIVELTEASGKRPRRLVFSGDLGTGEAPVMRKPAAVTEADLVLLESTYGDREHRSYDATLAELGEVFRAARQARGNILIPAFAVGRTQDLLQLLGEHYDEWGLRHWHVFLDSPMAIQATEVYAEYARLHEGRMHSLPNLMMSMSSDESMAINRIRSGAIIIAGSGMCTGGRIRHHLKHNVGRPETHIIIVGFQARGTLGRRLVDGAGTIPLWGETYPVRARVHTIGGLSAHADRSGLLAWYGQFGGRPPVCLVHGEERPQQVLAGELQQRYGTVVTIARPGERLAVGDAAQPVSG